jgi:hypothetical protein
MRKVTAAASPASVSKKHRLSPGSYVFGLTAVSSIAAASSIPDFSTFIALNTPQRKKPSHRWAVVTPSPQRRGATTTKAKQADTDEDDNRTKSQGAFTAANFPNLQERNIEIHTLILGTHPSVKSLAEEQYYGHPMK